MMTASMIQRQFMAAQAAGQKSAPLSIGPLILRVPLSTHTTLDTPAMPVPVGPESRNGLNDVPGLSLAPSPMMNVNRSVDPVETGGAAPAAAAATKDIAAAVAGFDWKKYLPLLLILLVVIVLLVSMNKKHKE